MAGLNGLTSQSLGSSPSFNWTWFIELVTFGILVLWFLFYLNRLFATCISYGIRTYSWHKFRVYIDIKSLQISFLGGRIFFKGVRYHGENETVYIHNGHLTWRYWLRVTKQIDLCRSASAVGREGKEFAKERVDSSGSESEDELPTSDRNDPEARLAISVTGLEWFIYNRTPVYDAIIQDSGIRASSSSSKHARSTGDAIKQAVGDKLRRRANITSDSRDSIDTPEEKFADKQSFDSPPLPHDKSPASGDSDKSSIGSNAEPEEAEVSTFYTLILRFFPVAIECSRGAVSLGNEHTKALIVTTFDKARGHIDAGASGPRDLFKQIFDFDIEHPVVQMKPNPDFHLPQMAAAERKIIGQEAVLKTHPWWRPRWKFTKRRRAFTHGLRNLLPHYRRSVASLHDAAEQKEDEPIYTAFADARPDSQEWHGLDRYMDEDEGDDHHAWFNIEYARFATLFDSPHVHLNFFWDTPGPVKSNHTSLSTSGLAIDLNGTAPPAYGMHLDVYGGLVNYGPWSDRLRAELQGEFLPAGYKTAVPKSALAEGDARLSTIMSITVDIKREITLRVPTREKSKDWRWRGRATAVRDAAALRRQQQRRHFRFRRSTKRRLGPDVRPFGWLAVAAGSGSRVQYVMDMYPGIDGYRNTLQLNLKNTKATSSVNHATLWECKEQNVSADLSNPLGWNELHTWRFDIMNKNMDMFLLRDHTFLLLDLINDFTAGLKSDYMTFMPFQYVIGVKFLDFNLLLNANDNNIIDNPCDKDENAFLILGFSRLAGQVDIPMKYFSPSQSAVHFNGDGQDASLRLGTPSWHTLHNFGQTDVMATLKTLRLNGSYNYFSSTSSTATDSLFMTIVGGYPKFHLQGHLIRYFMNVKDNYFGDTIHFSTLEEYQEKLDRQRRGEEEKKPPPKKENDLDVILSVRAENSAALMPANIYRRDENLRVDVLLIEADMRFTNYYMDLQVNSSPIEVSTEKDVSTDDKPKRDVSSCQLFIDGVSVYGHRLFGAPPTEPTYLCNWDFDVGNISGECTTELIRILISSIMGFIFTMDDDENALPKLEVEIIPDITFLRMRMAGLRTWIVSSDTAFLVAVDATTVELNDWANKHFSKYVKVHVPLLRVAAVDSIAAYRHRNTPDKAVPTYACIQTSTQLAVVDRNADFAHHRAMQQRHVRFHDSRTHRASWFLHKSFPNSADQKLGAWSRKSPAMPVPPMPQPVQHLDEQSHNLANTKQSVRASSYLTDIRSQPSQPVSQREHEIGSLMGEIIRPSASAHLLSSRWTRPRFQLDSIHPDLRFMPTVELPTEKNRTSSDAGIEEDDFPWTNAEYKHDGVFCRFHNGISGFCTPDLAKSIVTLLNEVSPQRPDSILDDLEIQVVSNIKKLNDSHVRKIDDLSFKLPAAHFRIVSHHEVASSEAGFDQYDIKLHDARVIVRIAPSEHLKSLKPNILMHGSLRELEIEASESRPQNDQFRSGAQVSVSDAGVWLSLRDETRARAQIGNLELVTAGDTIDSLAGLIERNERVISGIVDEVSRIDLASRTQHMLYRLTSVQDYVDPPFLSRAVNVLRTAEEHVRLYDSWVMIARLRYILSILRARGDTLGENPHLESREIKDHIFSSFTKWRSWGGRDHEDNALMSAVFGVAQQKSGTAHATVDIEIEMLLGYAALVLDPGPNQSQFYVRSLDFNFAEKLSVFRGADWSFGRQYRRTRVVQAYAGALGCHLDWELLKLLERVIALSRHFDDQTTGKPLTAPARNSPQSSQDIGLSIVLGADVASLELRSANLQLVTGVERFKACISTDEDATQWSTISILLNATSGRLRIRSRNRSILGCKVDQPTIYVDVRSNVSSSADHIVLHSAATCGKLRLHLKEDMLGLLRVGQAIVEGELVDVNQLLEIIALHKPNAEGLQTNTAKTPSKRLEPHVALFLGDYLMQFDLMKYLRYKISGQEARTSIVPFNKHSFSVQLDLKDNRHSFENPAMIQQVSKSVLRMPPISATISIARLADRLGIDAVAALEMITLEASAVRACFDAAYQPQTISYMKEMQQSIAQLQKSVKKTLPGKPGESEADDVTSRTAVQYSGHAVLEGIRLQCSAPALRSDQKYTAGLNLALYSTSIKIGNVLPGSTKLFRKPHFEFSMQRLTANIERIGVSRQSFGQINAGLRVSAITEVGSDQQEIQNVRVINRGIGVDLYAETAVLVVDLVVFLQDRIKSLAAAEDAKKLKPLRRLTLAAAGNRPFKPEIAPEPENEQSATLLNTTFVVELHAICLRWLVSRDRSGSLKQIEDLAFTIKKIDLRTTREASARLAISGMQLQLVPINQNPFERSANSALLPEMVFNAAYGRSTALRRFAFKAAGKLLDVRLASNFILPASNVQKSLATASWEVRSLKALTEKTDSGSSQAQLPKLLGTKRLAQLLIFADFGGAQVTVTPAHEESSEQSSSFGFLKGQTRSRAGRYGQAVQSSTGEEATLRAPGIAIQVEYADNGKDDPTLSTEFRVAASSNTLAPSVVPLLLQISASITNLMEQDNVATPKAASMSTEDSKEKNNESLQQTTDPTAILGRVKLNAGLIVQKQEFSLTCQPIARVSATARFEEIFVTVNTVQAEDQERFFSIITTFNKLEASVQHVYSRESTASFAVESIMVSLMNSKHFSNQSGISAILHVSPMKAYLNAKQMQDFMLFREIWYPAELRARPQSPKSNLKQDSVQGPVVQKIHDATTTSVLPWHAIVSIEELKLNIDFGQSIGKADFAIEKLWASSKKNSDAEQNLCIGFDKIAIDSSGRMSGFVELQGFRVRTAIRWPTIDTALHAPLVQGSIGFEHLRAKAVFDYQPFAVADVSSFEFLIYNVRQGEGRDRLVGILDGGKIQIFCTAIAAAQGYAISQAFERLIQEKQEAFEISLQELDRYLRRRSVFPSSSSKVQLAGVETEDSPSWKETKTSHAPQLQVDVVVTLRAIDAGVFMSSFFDETTLKLEAVDVSARFAVNDAERKTHSGLGMSLGQVRLALSTMSRMNAKALGEVSVVEVIDRATSARGGTILKVPRLVASMQTWQQASSNVIEYVFSSTFQGKVDIGWNYSRISNIRRMWDIHSKALAQKMQKPLPQSAIKITAEPKSEGEQEKITAVVHMPQSKYEYIALEAPIIDTPQLRDLGEATPSLEWIGLHRERLPHVTHSIIIVSLLEVAKEIEDTYGRILGSY